MNVSGTSWSDVRLGDVCELKYGKSLPESVRSGGDVAVFGSNGRVGSHDEALTAGPTIVIGRKGSFGEVNFSSNSCWPIDTTYYVDSTATQADLRWLTHRLAALGLNRLNKAAAVPGLNREDAYRQRLLLPPISEQRRIAEILDKADALRAKRRAALAQLDALTQSIFFDMFGDPATNPKGWPVTNLGAVISVGPQNGLYRHASDYGTGTPILRIDGFYHGVVTGLSTLKRVRIPTDEIDLYRLKPGQIVVNRVNSREFLGKSALVPELSEPTVFESNMMRFGTDESQLHPVFLIEMLQTQHVRTHILRAAKDAVNQSSINQQDVKSIPVMLPPLSHQASFASYVGAVRAVTGLCLSSQAKGDLLFASLQYRAFRGEL